MTDRKRTSGCDGFKFVKHPRKLIIVPHEHSAELSRWLDDADVKSFMTPEGYGGPAEGPDEKGLGANVTIWVEAVDFPQAHELAQSFLREMNARAKRDKCQGCGYDLRAHSGQGQCPECGHPFDIPQRDFSRKCSNCGEETPGDFEICWNCGKDLCSDTASL